MNSQYVCDHEISQNILAASIFITTVIWKKYLNLKIYRARGG
jgi:hypothetical protein